MALRRPDDVFDRVVEWDDLATFVRSRGGGLRVAVVYGRRRQGKSYLLRRLAAASGGFYHQALQEETTPALRRLGDALGDWSGAPGGRLAFSDWAAAIDAIASLQSRDGAPAVAIVDELPYLLDQAPELSSALQRAVDESRDRKGAPVRLIFCGSALSMMSDLLSGQRALRGRIANAVQLQPFGFRDAAAYWGVQDRFDVAVRMHAIVGGTPGYRDLIDLQAPRSVGGIGRWLAAGVCNPASAMFREDDYLLAEERGLTDRALYHSVLSAIAMGNHTETKIATVLGRDRQSLSWPLRVLLDAGFVIRDDDALRMRRPTYRIAEPIVRFHHVVTRRDLARFEERRALEGWADAQARFATDVLGPHFEDLARRWTESHASVETTGGALARVGTTQVSDPSGRSQIEIDVVGRSSRARDEVMILGEAKFRAKPVGRSALARLERARELIARRVPVAEGAKLLLFSASGFDRKLGEEADSRGEVELIDLERLYTGS
ncbi:MAG: ATP-binding protein [Solirubrobacteraceae bacterium]